MNTILVTGKKQALILVALTTIAIINGFSVVNAKNLEIPCTITTYGDAWEGVLGIGLFQYNPDDIWEDQHAYLVVMGTDGKIQYIRDSPPKSYNIVNWMDQDTLLFTGEPRMKVNLLDTSTGKIRTLPQQFGHHDIQYNPENGHILTLHKDVVEIDGMKYEHDRIAEVDPDGVFVWSWTTADHFTPEMACELSRIRKNSLDLTHSNSVDWDIDNDIVYVNLRNLNTFCKIDATNGELLWSLGEYGDFTLLDGDGNTVSSLWYHGHSVEQVEPNVFLLFDNDLHNKTDIEHKRSRILEITIDEDDMEAWVSWSWTAPRDKYSGYWGDADRLPNGNRLGVFGTQQHDIVDSTGAWLVEIDPEGEIVREYSFPYGWGMYRCEHIDKLEMFESPDFSDYTGLFMDGEVTMIYPSDAEDKAGGCDPAAHSDWLAAAILYASLGTVSESFDTDNFIVNQTNGAPITVSGTCIITVGGPIVNPVVRYYESEETPEYDRAPIRCTISEDRIAFLTKEDVSIVDMALSDVNTDKDYFLIEVFRDGRGRTVIIIYGFGWKGTLAAGKYFDRELIGLLQAEDSWIVGR